jgi:HK97 gp10 family phage protein
MTVNWAAIEQRVKAAAVAGLNEGADLVAVRAQGHAPVNTGRLRDEITAVPAESSEGSHFEAHVISPAPYSVFQEYGTGHNKPHPFLRPALHESHQEVTNLVRSGVRRAIRGVKAKERVEL